MPTLCRAYTTEQEMLSAVDRLLSAGVPGAEVSVLMGDAIQDARDTPVGTFAATTAVDPETVGSYAGAALSAREAMGDFASEDDDHRRGGFSDVDRETVTAYSADVKRVRIASHHNLKKLLIDAGLDEATASSDVEALHNGRILVLVRSTMALDEVAAVIDAQPAPQSSRAGVS